MGCGGWIFGSICTSFRLRSIHEPGIPGYGIVGRHSSHARLAGVSVGRGRQSGHGVTGWKLHPVT